MSPKISLTILRAFALIAIVVGVLSLLGVRPMNSRTVEITLGSDSILAGLVLLGMTFRAKSSGSPGQIA
jgi:hypothetical protein